VVLAVGAELVKVACAGELIEGVVLLAQLLLKIGEVLHDCGAVTDVAIAHTFLLCGILLRLRVLNSVAGFDC